MRGHIPRDKHTIIIPDLTELSTRVWRFEEGYQTAQINHNENVCL